VVPGYLLLPELRARFWPLEKMAFVSMPKTAMYKYNRIIFFQDYIRLSRQFFVMQPVPKSAPM